MSKTKTYLIGMPTETREKVNRFWKKVGIGSLIAVACAASLVVGYLVGLTCFYYG